MSQFYRENSSSLLEAFAVFEFKVKIQKYIYCKLFTMLIYRGRVTLHHEWARPTRVITQPHRKPM